MGFADSTYLCVNGLSEEEEVILVSCMMRIHTPSSVSSGLCVVGQILFARRKVSSGYHDIPASLRPNAARSLSGLENRDDEMQTQKCKYRKQGLKERPELFPDEELYSANVVTNMKRGEGD